MKHTWKKQEPKGNPPDTSRDWWESDDWRWTILRDDQGYSVRDADEWLEPIFETFEEAEVAINNIERQEIGTLFALLSHDFEGGQ